MDKELKAKWVAALRSGEFKQAKGVLYDEKADAYCCLGVLHTVAGVPREEWRDCAFGKSMSLCGNEDINLAKMNDSYGRSFAEIADYIERNL